MKKLLIISILLVSEAICAQTIIIKNDHENSAETETGYKNADYYYGKIREALVLKDYTKAKYYLDRWAANGAVDARLYVQFSEFLLATGETKKAKRKLMSAYKRFGCYECKEKAEMIQTDTHKPKQGLFIKIKQ